jgi:hypothetical protein
MQKLFCCRNVGDQGNQYRCYRNDDSVLGPIAAPFILVLLGSTYTTSF